MRHRYRHIPLSTRQLAGRAQIRDVQLLGNVVRVGDQVIAFIAIAMLSSLVRPLSLFLLELSAFYTRGFQFLCHGRQAFPLLFLFLFLFLLFFLFVVVLGIIVLGATGLTERKIIRWQKVLRQRMTRTVFPHSRPCHCHQGLNAD